MLSVEEQASRRAYWQIQRTLEYRLPDKISKRALIMERFFKWDIRKMSEPLRTLWRCLELLRKEAKDFKYQTSLSSKAAKLVGIG